MSEFATGEEVFRRLEAERLARIHDDTRMQCKVCWYVYDPEEGCVESQTPPGTSFKALPEWWTCPGCGNGKQAFLSLEDDDDEDEGNDEGNEGKEQA